MTFATEERKTFRMPCGTVTILSLREHPEMLETFIGYFSARWGHPEVYRDCLKASLTAPSPLPQWFLAAAGEGAFAGGAGLITNDFVSRMDLCPWLCALFVEESCRNQGLGGKLIARCAAAAESFGYRHLYCCTDHVGFYEKYGFEFIGTGFHPWGESSRIYQKTW